MNCKPHSFYCVLWGNINNETIVLLYCHFFFCCTHHVKWLNTFSQLLKKHESPPSLLCSSDSICRPLVVVAKATTVASDVCHSESSFFSPPLHSGTNRSISFKLKPQRKMWLGFEWCLWPATCVTPVWGGSRIPPPAVCHSHIQKRDWVINV